MEKGWLGDPTKTIAGETPLLCIILNSPAAIQRQAFMLVRPWFYWFAPPACRPLVWPDCKEAVI